MSDAPNGFERVTASDLADGELRGLQLSSGARVCVGRSAETVFAVCEECPHSGFPLSQGSVISVGVIECGWHGATFRIADGAQLSGPDAGPVQRYAVEIRDGFVWVGDSSGA